MLSEGQASDKDAPPEVEARILRLFFTERSIAHSPLSPEGSDYIIILNGVILSSPAHAGRNEGCSFI